MSVVDDRKTVIVVRLHDTVFRNGIVSIGQRADTILRKACRIVFEDIEDRDGVASIVVSVSIPRSHDKFVEDPEEMLSAYHQAIQKHLDDLIGQKRLKRSLELQVGVHVPLGHVAEMTRIAKEIQEHCIPVGEVILINSGLLSRALLSGLLEDALRKLKVKAVITTTTC